MEKQIAHFVGYIIVWAIGIFVPMAIGYQLGEKFGKRLHSDSDWASLAGMMYLLATGIYLILL